MGIDFNDAEGIEPELLEQAIQGEATMRTTVSTDGEATKLSNRGGGGGNDKSIDEVLRDSEQNLTKVRQIISQGGFTGPEKDKYELSLAHAEWVHARNTERKCDNEVRETSVKYTALVNGKAQTHEINKAHSDWKTVRTKCSKIDSELLEKANKYIEVDRRVRQNKQATDEYPATLPSGSTTRERFQVARGEGVTGVEGFTGTKEGFDFYNGTVYEDGNSDLLQASGTTPAVMKFNVRLPQYSDSTQSTSVNNEGKTATILPWSEYYVDCEKAHPGDTSDVIQARTRCKNANIEKDKYIMRINHEFDRADRLLNIYYNIQLKSSYRGNPNYLDSKDVETLLENQKKNIALSKQNALYDYDEYNSLSFYEDLVSFLYYAVFAIFVLMSLREFFSSSGAYDKRNIVILILLGLYPKYILPVVLWLLNGLTRVAEILGLKNVRFWKSTE
jgi:hypothetical protein